MDYIAICCNSNTYPMGENIMMKECCHCEKDFDSYGGVIYCDSCRWDLHYSRNWHTSQHYTKEEWMNEQRRHRVEGYRGRWK